MLEARAFTRDDATVLDWFVVRARRSATLPSTDQVITQIEMAGRGAADVDALVARQERRWDERPGVEVQLIEPMVAIDYQQRRDDSMRIEVEGRDAPEVR